REFLNTVKSTIGSPTIPKQPDNSFSLFGKKVAMPPPPGSGVMVAPPPPAEISNAFPEVTLFWGELTTEQRSAIQNQVAIINSNATKDQKDGARKVITSILQIAEGRVGRLQRLILEIGRALSEPYAFDVFAPDSFNYGLMLTYRQEW